MLLPLNTIWDTILSNRNGMKILNRNNLVERLQCKHDRNIDVK